VTPVGPRARKNLALNQRLMDNLSADQESAIPEVMPQANYSYSLTDCSVSWPVLAGHGQSG